MKKGYEDSEKKKGTKIEIEVNNQDRIDTKDNEKEESKEKPLEKMKKSELQEKVAELQGLSQKNYDLFLRSQAEIENIKKRNKKEKEEWIKFSNESLIKGILPVIDNLEKALSHTEDGNSLEALSKGVELTLKGLKDVLEKTGLEEIKASGEPFDPCFHDAVSEMVDENVESGVILQELQKGYILNQRLIRPAMVVVSKGKPESSAENTN